MNENVGYAQVSFFYFAVVHDWFNEWGASSNCRYGYLETGGKVKVVQPAQLAKRVSRAEGVIKYDGNKGYAQSSGFRIQVFSDNDYRTAKNNALYKEGLIQQAFPELETYVTFTSPFWRLRVGDFRSYEEAGNALIQLKKEFPQMAREMRVVRDKIHIQIHQGFTE